MIASLLLDNLFAWAAQVSVLVAVGEEIRKTIRKDAKS